MSGTLEDMSLRFSVGAEQIHKLRDEISHRHDLVRLLHSQLQDLLEAHVIRQLHQVLNVFDRDTVDLQQLIQSHG